MQACWPEGLQAYPFWSIALVFRAMLQHRHGRLLQSQGPDQDDRRRRLSRDRGGAGRFVPAGGEVQRAGRSVRAVRAGLLPDSGAARQLAAAGFRPADAGWLRRRLRDRLSELVFQPPCPYRRPRLYRAAVGDRRCGYRRRIADRDPCQHPERQEPACPWAGWRPDPVQPGSCRFGDGSGAIPGSGRGPSSWPMSGTAASSRRERW